MDAVLYYDAESTTVGKAFYGRLAANAGIALACARYGGGSHLACVAPGDEDARHLLRLMIDNGVNDKTLIRVRNYISVMADQDLGTLFRLDPNIGDLMWARAFQGKDAGLAVCGITHSLTPLDTQGWVGALTSAPVHPWDALICTSRAARGMVVEMLTAWREYTAERGGRMPACPIRLPVIPLGVVCDDFDPTTAAAAAGRVELRSRLGLGDEDVAVLFSGRLSFDEKAHPVPMFLALEEARRRSVRPLRFLMIGRFPKPEHEALFRRAAATFAPSVPLTILDGGDPPTSRNIRFAADIFLSLSDNLQETFGLTPIEAMAAGLPVVASAWDGYRDTVVDGECGVLAPTTMPVPGPGGRALGATHFLTQDYLAFLGATAQVTAVDVAAAAEGIRMLVDDVERRRTMSEAARRRARERYDWSVVVPQYEALWAESRAIRERDGAGIPRPAPPRSLDPSRLFGGFVERRLDGDWTVRTIEGAMERLNALTSDPLSVYRAPAATSGEFEPLVRLAAAPITLDALAIAAGMEGDTVRRRVAWLAKMRVLELRPPEARLDE